MPTYQYRCSSCGHELEVLQGMNDPVLTECKNCGTQELKRVITAGGGFVLKGSGFYNTDYKNNSKPALPCGAQGGGCSGGTCGLQ
ncbi:MAG: zinc ribbon domain-containing protein [Chlorobiales bacterium]|nr:zinc ribbon domain-containing protein [Chlorobiales bacterium]